MPNEREERLALNEAAFRVANERMSAWPERHEGERPESYFCECAHEQCTQRIELRRDQYESVRRSPRRFAVVPGHEVPDVETVVERLDGYLIVEKPPDLDTLIERTDPRSPP